MKLDAVMHGKVYVDTNVLYMYLRADAVHLPTIERFLQRVIRGEITAYVSVLALDELYYRLLLALVKEHTGRNPLDVLRDDLSGVVLKYCDRISVALKKLMELPHIVRVGVEVDDFEGMLENVARFALLPRDAFHVTLMQRLGNFAIASDDMDFDRVGGIDRHWIFNSPK